MTEAAFSWTDENVARLRTMVDEGGSAQAIADAMGCGRNAVMGKVHRLGLQLKLAPGGGGVAAAREARAGVSRAPATPKAPRPKPAPVAKPVLPPVTMAPVVDPTPKRWPKPEGPEAIAIEALSSRTCRMPLWSDFHRGGLYCGKPVSAEGSSWCAACRQLVYEVRPIRAREEAEAHALKQVRQQARSGAFA
ncbi:GcrA family cell cycle regulator [Bosea sp. ASV33]|uniref:GcrA family cell cycle regulator n=1 Tax=Bosea sp. ASV33 TaxID=2795106 RepID=UPI0018EC5A66|nr:GcrA family cell cycle regulator [Bosea sp. ASV33]